MHQHPIPDPDALPGHVEWQLSAPGADTNAVVAALAGEAAARAMDVSARDLYLAGLYAAFYGSRIEATRRCAGCGAAYDLDFDLRDLRDTLTAAPRPECVAEVLEGGRVRLVSGHVLRAPLPADAEAVAGMPLETAEVELLNRCVEGGDGPLDRAAAEEALEWLAPLLDIDLEGTCPDCDTSEHLRFSIEHYLSRSLLRERARLLREVHLLASSYRWSFDDILRLGRRDRRDLAALAEHDRSASRTGGWM